ncbi:MAG: hypothetical protein HFJ10_00790 [Lachnospiraceae bacterium]|nr:hypothetical protein [Lachnospiraceae bacterium]
MKRLGIYLTYDSQKIVDDYIGHMLSELKTCMDYLVVVCNETEIIRGREILEAYADEIFYRENIGLDAGGFKDALTTFVGWDRVLEFDELVLVNDSIFGPFCPMKEIFDEMAERPVDFWGVAGHGEYRKEGLDFFPEHIQTFFLTVRSKMLHSSPFRIYWEDMPYYASYNQVVREHEMQFTRHFSELGYTYDFFADIRANNSENTANNYCQYRRISYELIKKYQFPFLKKQQFSDDKLEEQTQESCYQALNYIDQETEYDVNLIWNNLIRTLDPTDLQKNLHLQYIISSESEYEMKRSNIVILVFISYEKTAEYVSEYLKELDFCIKIIAQDRRLLNDYETYGFECELVPQEDRIKYFRKFSDYDLVCIINDADLSSEQQPNYIGKSYFFSVWSNLLKEKNYILRIQELFDTKPQLGILTCPYPNFGKYFGDLGKGWEGRFQEICEAARKKTLTFQLSEDKPPFARPRDLWIRGNLLNSLEGWEAADFEYLSWLWIYLAQDSGYYSGIVESAEYAAMDVINMRCYLEEIAGVVRQQYGNFTDLIELKKQISQASLRDFISKCNHIYVYGTGIFARKYKALIPNPEAYVVSDGQAKLKELDGIPVRYLSELEITDDCGLVLCLNKKGQMQVIEQLKKRGIENYLCI